MIARKFPQEFLVYLTLVSSLLVIVIALLALLGWAFGQTLLASFRENYIPMAPSSALCFLCTSVGLMMAKSPSRWIPRLLALVVVVLAFAKLIEFVAGIHFGIDEGLVRNPAAFGIVRTGRMSPITAATFIFLAMGILYLTHPRSKKPAGPLGALVAIISLVVLMGYLYGTPLLYGGTVIPVALTVALAFLLSAVALTTAAGPEVWPLRAFLDGSTRALLLRSFLPVTIVLVFANGWVRTMLSSHFTVNPALFSAVWTSFVVLLFTWIISTVAALVGHRIDQAEKALHESEERFRQLSEQSQEVFWFSSIQPEKTLYVSPTVENIWGVPAQRFYQGSRVWEATVHPDDRLQVHQAYEASLAGKANRFESEYRILLQDGSIRWVFHSGTPIHNSAGEIIRMGGLARDITERKKVEEQIHQQASLLDQTQDAIYVRDLEWHITYWNKGAERLYGWKAEEVLGKRTDELFSKEGALRYEEMQRLTLDKGDWMGELEQLSKSGKKIIVESRRTLLRDAQGNPKSVLVTNTDITAYKKIQNQMLRAQRMESIGTLAGGVAHDLNNALAPILMATGLLRTQHPNQNAINLIETVESSAVRSADMVRQLLTFAKGVEGARLFIQPQQLLGDMEKIMERTFPKNIELCVAHGRKTRTILGDPTQLHQVLLNLCVNARDAMPKGGSLTLEAQDIGIDHDLAGSLPEVKAGPYVVFRIKDTGTGIPPEILDRIFEPFFTTKGPDKGTGLGLSTVVGIVESHGGFVRVHSKAEKGTTFTVYLPAKGSGITDTASLTRIEPTFRGHGETILVVDDEIAVRQIARDVLTVKNFQVITASSGAEALIQVAEIRTDLRAVITDLHMPQMDGLALVKAMKPWLSKAGIIVASGCVEEREAREFKALGAVFLEKPFTQELLIGALQSVLQK